MVQVDLITGFLGAGKTTFLRRYVRYLVQQGHKVCILENDFGAVNVDAMLVQEVLGPGCDVETISGGCDCDTHQRRMRTKLIAMAMRGFDRVVVEPSGIFDVDEFFDILRDDPLDRWYQLGSVIAIVDALLPEIELRLASIAGEQHIYLKDEDVSTAIRTEAAGMAASAVGANPAVRAFLLDLQRSMAKKQDVLMDGRDIGTVVLPDATVKIFLTATPEARATRRWKEYQAKGIDTPYEEVLADVKQRDYQDTHRAAAPLKQAEDAVLLDTSELDFEQSLDAMKQIIAKKIG